MLLVQRRGETAVIPSVTVVLLIELAMDKRTECNDVTTG